MAVSKRLRFEVLRRDNHTCRYCGAKSPDVVLVVDHVLAEALGGTDDPTNLVTACEPCNSGKSATPPAAALVAEVDQSATRWAAAIARAALVMLDENTEVRESNEKFRSYWNGWRRNQFAKPEPLPNDWPSTLERFRSLGLPDDLLYDAVEITMTRPMIQDKFRYFCGVAWGMVRDLQERAAAELDDRPVVKRASRTELLAAVLDRCDPPLSAWEYDRIIYEFVDALRYGTEGAARE